MKPNRNLFHPQLEALEERTLLSARAFLQVDAAFPGLQTLMVEGTAANDKISIANSRGTVRVKLNGASLGAFNQAGIGQIVANGLDGNDTISLGKALNLNAILRGGAGNDRLTGGRGINTFDGGYGNDRLTGRAASDLFFGGEGDDHLFGGAGNDILNGGGGRDILNAGQGQDMLLGGGGNDVLKGTRGIDSLFQDSWDAVQNLFSEPWYGNYAGPGNYGYDVDPISSLDAAARNHDLAYDFSGANGIWSALFDTSVSGDDWRLSQDAFASLSDPDMGWYDQAWGLGIGTWFGGTAVLKETYNTLDSWWNSFDLSSYLPDFSNSGYYDSWSGDSGYYDVPSMNPTSSGYGYDETPGHLSSYSSSWEHPQFNNAIDYGTYWTNYAHTYGTGYSY